VASEIRQGVFSEVAAQTFKRDCAQRSTGLSSQAATAKLQSTTKIGRATGRWMMGKGMGLIVPFKNPARLDPTVPPAPKFGFGSIAKYLH
jgi:hypothetical protein